MKRVLRMMGYSAAGLSLLAALVVVGGLAWRADATPHALAAEHFRRVSAPEKAFVTVPGAGHFAVASHAPQLRAFLLDRVRPPGLAAEDRR